MRQTPKQWITTGLIFATAIAAAALAAPPKATISGTIELDPSVAGKVHLPAIVFVTARDEVKQGAPLLAKRLDVRRFPVAFSLGTQDAMMGAVPPPRVSLEARIDLDGDAATREPGTPSASIDSVAMGATNVVLRLR